MAAINLPFAASATRRAPDADELANGYGCGPADIELFDWMGWWQTAQIAGAVRAAGETVDDTIISQLAKAISKGVYLGALGGSANALTGTIPGSVTFPALVAGMRFFALITTTNTGAATLDLTGFTSDPAALNVIRQDGAALIRGDLSAGDIREFRFDGTSFRVYASAPQVQRALTIFGAAQSLPNGVETAVEFVAPASDPLGFFNPAQPTRLTIPSGITKVRVSGVIAFGTSNVGYRQQRILQNGGAIPAGGRINLGLPNGANITPLNITGFPVDVSPGDYFTMLGFQNSALSLANDPPSTIFNIEY